MPSTVVWARLSSQQVARSMATWGVSWQTVDAATEALSTYKISWTREKDGMSCFGRASICINSKLLILARTPSFVAESEARDAIPEIGMFPLVAHLDGCLSYSPLHRQSSVLRSLV